MRLLFSILACISVLICQAQTAQEIHETFDNNKNSWGRSKDDAYNCYVQKGAYHIHHTTGSIRNFPAPFTIEREPYEVSAMFHQVKGSHQHNHGLYFETIDVVGKFNSFVINLKGQYKIYKYNGESNTDVTEWKDCKYINTRLGINQLQVNYDGENYIFYINAKQVEKIDKSEIIHAGKEIGITMEGTPVNLEVDNFYVKKSISKINLIKETPKGIMLENLGPAINSASDEVQPYITPDGKTLYFSRYHPDNFEGSSSTDIWYSEQKDNHWSAVQHFLKPLNNKGPNSVICSSPDNNKLYLQNKYTEDGEDTKEGTSYSLKTADGWSFPQEIIIKDHYNDNEYEERCMSNDGNIMLLTMERKEGFGSKDVYVCFRNSDDSWTTPLNLGATVNTSDCEISPFLASDNKTVYYATSGFVGYGSSDIYMTRRLDDTWKKWSVPVNLGPSINSHLWEAYFSVSAEGNYAFMVSTHNAIGGSDIFKIKLPEKVKPEPVTMITGHVYDKKTGHPIGAEIIYEDLNKGEVGRARSNPKTGEYKIVLPYGKTYGFSAKSKNYIGIHENMDLTKVSPYQEVKRDLYLNPLENKEPVRLNNVFFVQSKPDLLPTSYPELDKLVSILKEHPKSKIELSGHTDNIGDAGKNLKLSNDRAVVVKNYLISKGIDTSRINAVGYGGTKPIAASDTEENKKLNRRVEVKFLN